MKENELKIIAPEGYEIIRENDTITFKKIEKKFPKSWEEYCEQMDGKKGYRTDTFGEYEKIRRCNTTAYSTFNSKEEANAFCALGKLIQLRDAWVKNWKPDWKNKDDEKFSIIIFENSPITVSSKKESHSLAFPTPEMCDVFLSTFRDLINEAKMFL